MKGIRFTSPEIYVEDGYASSITISFLALQNLACICPRFPES